MPRELVTIQVGQCGNQVGCRFWELALREHAAYNTKGVYDEALSSFFRNVDTRVEPPRWGGEACAVQHTLVPPSGHAEKIPMPCTWHATQTHSKRPNGW